MGFGNKMRPEMIEIAKIEKTSVCPMARMVRRILKKKGLSGLTVAFSKEPNLVPDKSDVFKYELPTEFRENNDIPRKITPGSNAFVPGTAGFVISAYVIRKLLNME
jgi:hydrogenase accessory protein hypB